MHPSLNVCGSPCHSEGPQSYYGKIERETEGGSGEFQGNTLANAWEVSRTCHAIAELSHEMSLELPRRMVRALNHTSHWLSPQTH